MIRSSLLTSHTPLITLGCNSCCNSIRVYYNRDTVLTMAVSISYLSAFVALLAACWVSFRDHPIRFTARDSAFRERYGDWAIVAGASEGLGAAWVHTLCEHHVNVLLVARREKETKQLADELQAKYPEIAVDILVQDLAASNLQEVFQDVINNSHDRRYGLLVYNAAHMKIGPFIDSPLETQYTSVDVNIRGVLTLSHILSNHVRARGGTGGIILMSSLSGELGTASISNYAGTKAWNTAFAHGLGHELSPLGIDVFACVAGPVTTPNYIKAVNEEGRKKVIEQTAEEVVSECVQAIGSRSSIRTGVMNKISRFLVMRLLPMEMAITIFNEESAKVMVSN